MNRSKSPILLLWTRGKFSITLPIFWSLKILHISESENSQALPPHKITNIPPTLNPAALKGTTAAEFTENQKSTSISSANNNNIQNKATNINSMFTGSPLLREPSYCSLALLTFLSKKSWRDADRRNQSCCHLSTWTQEPQVYTPELPPCEYLQPVRNQVFIKNSWASKKKNRLKMRINLVQLRKKTKKGASPPAFPACSFHKSLEHLQELPLQVHPRVYLLFIPRQISNHQPLPELCEMTLWLPHLRLCSQAFPSVPRLQVLWKVPATRPPPLQMLLISPAAKISFFSGLRLLPIRVGKMKGKQMQRHGWK